MIVSFSLVDSEKIAKDRRREELGFIGIGYAEKSLFNVYFIFILK